MSRAENPTYTPVRLTASGLLKDDGGACGGFLVASGTPTVTLYDNDAASGKIILNGLVTVAGQWYPFPGQFNDGLYAVLAGAGDITFFI